MKRLIYSVKKVTSKKTGNEVNIANYLSMSNEGNLYLHKDFNAMFPTDEQYEELVKRELPFYIDVELPKRTEDFKIL
ncbi:hypothetical protein AB0537_001265 [Vibrio parahaemolyticus]|nr:hypothetical protein IC830_07160 [Vibrio parahaemolyticus]